MPIFNAMKIDLFRDLFSQTWLRTTFKTYFLMIEIQFERLELVK